MKKHKELQKIKINKMVHTNTQGTTQTLNKQITNEKNKMNYYKNNI